MLFIYYFCKKDNDETDVFKAGKERDNIIDYIGDSIILVFKII